MLNTAKLLKPYKPDFVSITYGAAGTRNNSSLCMYFKAGIWFQLCLT